MLQNTKAILAALFGLVVVFFVVIFYLTTLMGEHRLEQPKETPKVEQNQPEQPKVNVPEKPKAQPQPQRQPGKYPLRRRGYNPGQGCNPNDCPGGCE